MCVDPDPAIGDPPTAADFIVLEHLQVFLVTVGHFGVLEGRAVK